MELRDNIEAKASAESTNSAKLNLLDESSATPTSRFVNQESSIIADMLNHAGRYGNAGCEMVKPAATELSAAMKQLSGQDCNELLKQIQAKQDDYFAKSNNEHQFVGRLELKDWNEQTNTWNDVTLCGRQAGYPMRPEIRIAQPGNTLWEMATDRLAENNGGKKEGFSTSDVRAMVKDTAALNAIADPSKIAVGDAITLPMWNQKS
jgi:hypothetical protein